MGCVSDCHPEDACTTYTCVNQMCVYDGCEEDTCCSGGGHNYCADLENDRWNCGGCGYACDGCQVCLNGYCVDTDACCGVEGDSCGYYVRPAGGDSSQLSCCDGLVCCHPDNAGDDDDDDDDDYRSSYCAYCCSDWDCPSDQCCVHGHCKPRPPHEHECESDDHCKTGECCCANGKCSADCCGGTSTVDTLPNTGSGDTAGNTGAWMGAAALGAAAYVVGKTLRNDSMKPEAESVDE
ncbi:MAG: hypothetical protein R2839_07490 [Thermomicrobiales bacterium]